MDGYRGVRHNERTQEGLEMAENWRRDGCEKAANGQIYEVVERRCGKMLDTRLLCNQWADTEVKSCKKRCGNTQSLFLDPPLIACKSSLYDPVGRSAGVG